MRDRREVELDALRALAGADDVRKRLLAALAMGNPSLESQAYLIKSRVKSHESLVEKIIDRRRERPAYNASEVTDIVGLRLLTLYRSELPALFNSFLSFVEWAQQAPVNLFVGDNLKDAVEEIIIYRTPDLTDVNFDLVARQLELRDFLVATERQSDTANKRSVAHVEVKQTRYSSVHVVLWCNGLARGENYRIPLEVQLRTSLEDTWGEIEHRLQYKRGSAGHGDSDRSLSLMYSHTQQFLRTLKRQLDTSGEFADHIQQQVHAIRDQTTYEAHQNVKSVSVNMGQLTRLRLRKELQKRLNEVFEKLGPLYRSIYSQATAGSTEHLEHGLDIFKSAATEIAICLREYLRQPDPNLDRDADIQYALRMEEALCLYWRAFLLKTQGAQRIERLSSGSDFATAIQTALQRYIEVSRDPRFVGDALLAFRIGNALALRGESALALAEYRKAYERLPDDRRISPRSYMRVRIPRQFGLALWGAAQEIARTSMDQDEARHLYLEALDVTRSVLDIPIDDGGGDVIDRQAQSKAQEHQITVNNILEYAIEYLKVGGTWEDLARHQVTEAQLRSWLQRLCRRGVDKIDRATVADTVRSAASFLGDRPLAKRAARRVLILTHSRRQSAFLPHYAFRQMNDDARRELRRLQVGDTHKKVNRSANRSLAVN